MDRLKSRTVALGYGVIMIAGGLLGASRGSVMSLVMGGSIGGAVIALEAFGRGGDSPRFAQTALAAATAVMMLHRAWTAGKLMPAGMVGMLSLAFALYNGLA
jgi:hypothetical protein